MVIFKKKIAGLSTVSLERFVLRARKAVRLKTTVDVLVTSNSEMRTLNTRFRSKSQPTDVLSFPTADTVILAGEIAISAEIAIDNARRLGHSAQKEVKVLVLHGILHLAGYDHERDNGKMARKEAILRRTLKLPSSLTERAKPGRSNSSKFSRRSPRSARRQRTA